MTRFLVIGGLVIAIAAVAIVGCGPRVEVAKDAIIKKLDKALGELNVKRAKIKKTQDTLRNKLEELRQNRHLAAAKLKLMESKKDKSKANVDDIMAKVETVRGLISQAKQSEDGTITRGDKTYTAEDIQKTAEEVAARAKAEKTKFAGYEASYAAMKKSVDFLIQQEKTSSDLMANLNQKIEEIDAKKVAVDAVKQASAIAGNDSSISDDLAKLEKEIEDLGVNVDAALSLETEKMTELQSATDMADDILSEPASLDNAEKMLDDLLKN